MGNERKEYSLSPSEYDRCMEVLLVLWQARKIDNDDYVSLADKVLDLYTIGTEHDIRGLIK